MNLNKRYSIGNVIRGARTPQGKRETGLESLEKGDQINVEKDGAPRIPSWQDGDLHRFLPKEVSADC